MDHRQWVWTIPKVLRSALRRDRKLLGELCRCAGQTLREYLEAALGPGYTPGASFAIQTWGDPFNGHPHIHAWVSDRAWIQDGVPSPFGGIDSAVLSRLFQQNVLDRMVAQRRLSPQFAQQLRSWQHSGFAGLWWPPRRT